MRAWELLNVDEAKVLVLAREHALRIVERASIRLPERFNAVD